MCASTPQALPPTFATRCFPVHAAGGSSLSPSPSSTSGGDACSETATSISVVQGTGTASPLEDSVVVIRGTVTAVFPSLQGWVEIIRRVTLCPSSDGARGMVSNASRPLRIGIWLRRQSLLQPFRQPEARRVARRVARRAVRPRYRSSRLPRTVRRLHRLGRPCACAPWTAQSRKPPIRADFAGSDRRLWAADSSCRTRETGVP